MDLRVDIMRMVGEIKSTAILKKLHRVVKLLYDAQRGRGKLPLDKVFCIDNANDCSYNERKNAAQEEPTNG